MILRNVIIVLFFSVLLMGLKQIHGVIQGTEELPAAVSLGFILIVSYSFASLVHLLGLPRLNGYIFWGMIAGPFLLELISEQAIVKLELINEIAIVFIALIAGGEIHLHHLRDYLRYHLWMIAMLVLCIMGGVGLMVWVAQPLFTAGYELSSLQLLALALLLGVTGVSKSPSTTIAIIQENRARGQVTEFILALVVFLDVVVIFLFTLVTPLSKGLLEGTRLFDPLSFLMIFYSVAGAILPGVVLGIVGAVYLRYVRANLLLFIFSLCVLVAVLGDTLEMEPIIIALTVGIFISNFTSQGTHLIHAIERGSLLLYVVFFTLAGAGLKLNFLLKNWLPTLLLTVGTTLFTFAGALLGARISQAPKPIRQYSYLGLVSQAGVTLGFAVLVRNQFAGGVGEILFALIVARITINQIVGPIFLRWALIWSGEAQVR